MSETVSQTDLEKSLEALDGVVEEVNSEEKETELAKSETTESEASETEATEEVAEESEAELNKSEAEGDDESLDSEEESSEEPEIEKGSYSKADDSDEEDEDDDDEDGDDDDDEDDAKKSLSKSLTEDESVRKATEVSDFLKGLTTQVASAMDSLEKSILEDRMNQADTNAKLAEGILAVGELVKSLSERVEELGDTPARPRRSVGAIEKSFGNGSEGASEEHVDLNTQKQQILKGLATIAEKEAHRLEEMSKYTVQLEATGTCPEHIAREALAAK
jgi:hypothetical protein